MTKWIEVPPGALRGEGLEPYPPGGTSDLFDWSDKEDAGSRHLMPHFGQFILDIVEIEPHAVHQPSKPGDELVVVIEGALSLTTDDTGDELVIPAGGMVLIPAGWAGVYRVLSDEGWFRELALVPCDYFDPAAAPPPSGLSPRRLDPPRAAGRHGLHRGRYALEAENGESACERPVSAPGDEVIQILAGTLTLTAADDTASFGPGSVVVLPRGFVGTAATSAGYRALNARWLG